MVDVKSTPKKGAQRHSLRWFVGMLQASIFSLIYFIAPFYILTALVALFSQYPSSHAAWLYAAPLIVSALTKPIAMPGVLEYFRPMLDYFDYEEIHESSPVDVKKEILNGKNYLCVFQPHGALSLVGISSAINAPPEFRGSEKFPTAVADAVL